MLYTIAQLSQTVDRQINALETSIAGMSKTVMTNVVTLLKSNLDEVHATQTVYEHNKRTTNKMTTFKDAMTIFKT